MSFNGSGSGISGASDVAMSSPQNNDVLTYVTAVAKWENKPATAPSDATTTSKGVVQLAGDLGGTATAPTVPGLASKANTSAVVQLTGNQTISGVKTFSNSPIVPTPLATTEVTNKSYVDTAVANKAASGANSDITSLTGLTTPLSVGQGGTGSATKSFVDLSTAQTVAGVKTFSSSPVVPTPVGTTDAANKAYVDSKTVTVPDATTTAKGIVQLAGDLAGTAATPSVAKVKGVALPASAPTNGQVLTATSATATAWSTPQVAGGSPVNPKNKTSNYTAVNYDFVICDASAAGFTVTLPTPAAGAIVRVLKRDSSVNAVIVATTGNPTLNGSVSYSVNQRWMSQDFASDGVDWFCV